MPRWTGRRWNHSAGATNHSLGRVRHCVRLAGVLAVAALGVAPARAVDATWTLNGDGNWDVAGNWSGNVVPTNNTFNVFIDDGDMAVTVNFNRPNTVIANLTIGADDELSFAENRALGIAGSSVVNNGVISLNSLGVINVNTDINFTAPVATLSGNGTLLLGGAFQNRVTNSALSNELINSATHTIAGGGQLGFNGMKLTNQGLYDANIAAATLFVDPSS